MTKFATRFATAAAVVASTIALSTIAVSAAEITKFKAGPWDAGAYSNNNTGAFSHCAADAEYKSGIKLIFSVTKKRQWYLGLAHRKWDLSPGNKYPVRFQVDNGPVLKSTARVLNKKVVEVFLPPRDKLFSHFRTGSQLKVVTGSKRMTFDLTGTDQMLSKLYRCATHFAKRERNDPFAASDRDPFRSKPKSKHDPFAGQPQAKAEGQPISGSSFF